LARKPTAGANSRGDRDGDRRGSDATGPSLASVPDAAVPVVGVGASAGGIAAFQTLVSHIPQKSGIAWVLIQHMAPNRDSQLCDILSRCTDLPVAEVKEDTPVAPDRIYVISPGHTMTLRDGTLRSVSDHDPLARRTSIDAFFLSLAKDQHEHCGAALLTGAGTDGTIGLKAVKEAGGLTLTQTLGTAQYDSMLLSAVRTGVVDRELPIEEMAGAFTDFLIRRRPLDADETFAAEDRTRACDLLRSATGHDFSGYKTGTVDRRIRRRMQMLGITTLPDYLARLHEDKNYERTQKYFSTEIDAAALCPASGLSPAFGSGLAILYVQSGRSATRGGRRSAQPAGLHRACPRTQP